MNMLDAESGNAYVLDVVLASGKVSDCIFEDCIVVLNDDCEFTRNTLFRCMLLERDETGNIGPLRMKTIDPLSDAPNLPIRFGDDGTSWPPEKVAHLQALAPFRLPIPA